MNPKSPALTIGGTVLKESDDLVILGVTFDSKMSYEKHLRSVPRAASQRLGILRKSWQVFHDRLFLVRCFRGFVLPVLEWCSAVWCSADDTHLKLLDCVVSGASFLTGGVFECDFAHHRTVAVLCMLYKIRCNPIHPFYGSYLCRMCRCVLHTALWLHMRCLHILSVYLWLAAEPRSTAGLSFTCQYLCGTILVTPYSIVWDWRVSRAGLIPFYLSSCSLPFCLILLSLSLLSFYGLVLWGWGLRTVRVLIAFSQPCIASHF